MFPPRLFVLTVALLAGPAASAAERHRAIAWDTAWQNNLGNAQRDGDRIEAWSGAATLRHRTAYRLRGNQAVTPEIHGRLEWFPDVTALSAATLGGAVSWQRKLGLGNRPTMNATAGAQGILTRERARRSVDVTARLAVQQRLATSVRAELSTDLLRRVARESVFDRTVRRGSVQLHWDASSRFTASVHAFLQSGSTVSHATPPRPDLVALARTRLPVTTFGRPMVAYSLRARTTGVGASLGVVLTEKLSFRASVEDTRTRRDGFAYRNQLVSASLLHQF